MTLEQTEVQDGRQPLDAAALRALDAYALLSTMSAGPRERHIREQLGMKPVRYFQLLNALIDDERALRHNPVVVHALRRAREENRRKYQ